jgi:hypothetical protein
MAAMNLEAELSQAIAALEAALARAEDSFGSILAGAADDPLLRPLRDQIVTMRGEADRLRDELQVFRRARGH